LIPKGLSFFVTTKSLEECECKGFDSEIGRAEMAFGVTATLLVSALVSAEMREVLKSADFGEGD
jgi:hypothetical protein